MLTLPTSYAFADALEPSDETVELAYRLSKSETIVLTLKNESKAKKLLGELKVSLSDCEAKVRTPDPSRSPRDRDYVKCSVHVKGKDLEFKGIALTVGNTTNFDMTLAMEEKNQYSLDFNINGSYQHNTGKWTGEGLIDGWFSYKKGRLTLKLECKEEFEV